MSHATRRALAHRALLTAVDVRKRAGLDLSSPVDVFGLCESLGIAVRFVDYSMEGIYVGGPPPRILLSALRPLPRRAFTCGHELGHHVYGHGATIDELVDETREERTFHPEEFLVQTFAGFLLMPVLGVRKAFAARGWSAAAATPGQIFTVACSFGVGYGTLLNHLAYSLEMLPPLRAQKLLKVTLPAMRREVLGIATTTPLIIADRHWAMPTLDAEVGTQILFPSGTEAEGCHLAWQADLPSGRLFVVTRPGITRVHCADAGLALFVRASRYQYVGLSRFRHIEEMDSDDEESTPAT